jgi:hypothetical protein
VAFPSYDAILQKSEVTACSFLLFTDYYCYFCYHLLENTLLSTACLLNICRTLSLIVIADAQTIFRTQLL